MTMMMSDASFVSVTYFKIDNVKLDGLNDNDDE